jgi:co-chaperonin GroES (HSP10)
MSKPIWTDVKDRLMPAAEAYDPKGERKALDAMFSERDLEIKTSAKSRKWEEDRKKEWQANKPQYLKDLASKNVDPAIAVMNKIKNGGDFETDIHPFTNFILVDPILEQKSDSGIILVTEESPNTAYVVESCKQCFLPSGDMVDFDLPQGQKILFRRFSGMEVVVKGKQLLMITIMDIIGLID